MSKFNVTAKYSELGTLGKIFFAVGMLFLIFAGYYIGTSILQYLLANVFSIYYSKYQIFIAAMCWGIFESLSGAGMRGNK